MSRIDNDGGKLLVVGTRLRPKDLYSELRDPMRYPDETSPWTYFAQPAVLEFHDDPKEWKTLWAKTNMPPVSGKGIPDENGLYTKWDGDALFKKRGRMSPNLWAMVYQQQQVHEDAVFPGDSVKGVINGARNIGIIPKNKAGNRPEGMDGLVVVAGLETIEYPVIAEPPVAPGVIVSIACAFPPAALTLGACGTVVAVTADDADEAEDVPKLLVAVTV
jgi:hypothetical protein